MKRPRGRSPKKSALTPQNDSRAGSSHMDDDLAEWGKNLRVYLLCPESTVTIQLKEPELLFIRDGEEDPTDVATSSIAKAISERGWEIKENHVCIHRMDGPPPNAPASYYRSLNRFMKRYGAAPFKRPRKAAASKGGVRE